MLFVDIVDSTRLVTSSDPEVVRRRVTRFFEIGAGSGYNAALLKGIVGETGSVVTVEIQPDVARRAEAALL